MSDAETGGVASGATTWAVGGGVGEDGVTAGHGGGGAAVAGEAKERSTVIARTVMAGDRRMPSS